MENNKGQTIFLSVVGVATLLVAIVGATFAYFSITVKGNEAASSIIIQTASLTSIEFKDGQEISVTDAYPGAYVEKTFSIVAAASEGTLTTNAHSTAYDIKLNVIENDLMVALNTAGKLNELTYSLVPVETGGTGQAEVRTGDTPTDNTNGVTPDGTLATAINLPVQEGPEHVNGTAVSADLVAEGSDALVGSGVIYPEMTHTYRYRLTFEETGKEQNYAQGKSFVAKLRVDASSEGHYTTGDGGSGSSLMPTTP